MDFWAQIGNFSCNDDVKNLLNDPNCSLEKVLDEDQLQQEIIGNYDPLIKYLTKDENFDKLLDFILIMPNESTDDRDGQLHFASIVLQKKALCFF